MVSWGCKEEIEQIRSNLNELAGRIDKVNTKVDYLERNIYTITLSTRPDSYDPIPLTRREFSSLREEVRQLAEKFYEHNGDLHGYRRNPDPKVVIPYSTLEKILMQLCNYDTLMRSYPIPKTELINLISDLNRIKKEVK